MLPLRGKLQVKGYRLCGLRCITTVKGDALTTCGANHQSYCIRKDQETSAESCQEPTTSLK